MLILSNAYALDYLVEVKQVSSSGKTVLINKGSVDTINSDDYGILLVKDQVKNKKTEKYYTVYKPVAKLKAVKVLSDRSIWIAFKVFIPKSLKKNAKLLFLSESDLLQGRADLKINRKSIVGKEDKIETRLEETLIDDGNFLAKKSDKYYESTELHDQEKKYDEDIKLIDLNTWEENRIEGELSYHGFYSSPYAEEFSDRKRVHRFEKMVVAFMRKFNDPKFTLKKLYLEQQRSANSSGLVQSKMLKSNFFNEYQRDLDERKKREDKFYQDLLSKGESWSDEYSDEELGELMYNIGAIRERERRNSIAAQRYNYQVFGSFGLNLVNNENLKDRDNTQQSKYDLEFGLEYFFLKKLENLNRFSLEGSFRYANDAFSTGSYNAVSQEYSMAVQVNWYPFLPPNTIERNIIYLGVLLRYGLMRASIPSLSEEANYQVNSFPGLRAGLKYNFNNGFGGRIGFGLERINVEREVRSLDDGVLPDRATYTEGKISFAISRFY